MPDFPEPNFRHVLDAGCARCSDLVESRERIAWGNGPDDADVVLVGEAPAAGDPDAERWRGGNLTGFAYTSRHSGRRIRALFEDLGYGNRTYYTNAVKCFPSDGAGSNREPTPAERRTCRTHLETELDRVAPAVVVPTGKHATASVFDLADRRLDGFLDAVLDPVPLPAFDATILPILHPSYQDVWRGRLGYSAAEYREAVGAVVADALSRPAAGNEGPSEDA